MKIEQLLLISLILLNASGFAQKKRDLFYFLSKKDSLLGVKDQEGNIVIPAKHINLAFAAEDFAKPITEQTIIMLPKNEPERTQPYNYGLAYNREGKVLYAPYLYDNGPDYLEEGLSRFVENGKIGFVDRAGKKVIPAQWDWVSPFEYGIAKACTNCFLDYTKDQEHPPLDLSKAQTSYIDKQGKAIIPLTHIQKEEDQHVDGVYLPYQFHYTPFEQQILAELQQYGTLISNAYFVNYTNRIDSEEKVLHFEIVERPSAGFDYYVIQAFRYNADGTYVSTDWNLQFYADKEGSISFNPYFEDEQKTPLKEWLPRYDAEARQYLQEHPEAVNRYE